MKKQSTLKTFVRRSVLVLATVVLAGCGGDSESDVGPSGEVAYLEGFDDGFADDSEYYLGYDEGFMTVGAGPVLYSGDLIPFSEFLTYQAGFWDGQFEAYNDGYFVEYRFAFIIGFSEGYDSAFAGDYIQFLANDHHLEFLHGGFSDGYNDGFSEGRIFGAFDYEVFLPFDWLDAFLDWEAGTDLFFEEVGKGTGDSGPVVLYEWGVNPHDLVNLSRDESEESDRPHSFALESDRRMRLDKNALAAKSMLIKDVTTQETARAFTNDQIDTLAVAPDTTSRTSRELTLTTTWFERINAYLNDSNMTRSERTDRSTLK